MENSLRVYLYTVCFSILSELSLNVTVVEVGRGGRRSRSSHSVVTTLITEKVV